MWQSFNFQAGRDDEIESLVQLAVVGPLLVPGSTKYKKVKKKKIPIRLSLVLRGLKISEKE